MLEYYGEIAIFHNLTFNYGKKDHAITSGRPCIVLNNDLDMPIILPLTTVYHGGSLKSYYFKINKSDIKILDKSFPYKDICYANINGIIKSNQYYYDVVSHLDYETYLKLLKFILLNFVKLNNSSQDMYNLIKNDLIEQKNTLEKVLESKLKRNTRR